MLGIDEAVKARWRREGFREDAISNRQRVLAENLQRAAVTVEDDAGHDVSSVESQMGRPLASSVVQAKLKRCNPRLFFERSIRYPELTGVYLVEGERAIHICGMESGMMPEFSVIKKKTIKIPNQDLIGNKTPTREVEWSETETFASETRGWRTVLIRLLHKNLITRGDVEKHFGWTPSRDSQKWAEQTK